MATKYDFDREDGVRIARHHSDPKKDVRLDASWVTPEPDEVFAPWEDLVATIMSEDITSYIDVSDGESVGTVDVDQACQNLVSGTDVIENERHARALIECFIEEDIVKKDGDEIVLFQNVSATEMDNPNFLYNWAAAMQMVRGKIEQQIDRAEKLEEQMNEKLEDIVTIGTDFIDMDPDEQIQRAKKRLQALGDDDRVPRNPEELPPAEQRKYQDLRRTVRIARSRKNIQDNVTIEKSGDMERVDPGVLIQGQIENFQQLQQAFVEYERTLRLAIEYNEWNDHGISDLLDGLVDMLSDIARIDQSLDDQSTDEFADYLEEFSADAEEAYEGIEQLEDTNEDPENRADEIDREMERGEFENTFE